MSIYDDEKIRIFNPAYVQLKDLRESGDLRIVWQFSLPRSYSTAVEIALSESSSIDGQFHEPLYLNGPTHESMNSILCRYHELQKNAEGHPVTLLIKDTFSRRHMDEKNLAHFFNLCHDFIVLVRDPIEVMESVVSKNGVGYVDDVVQDAIGLWKPFHEIIQALQGHLYDTGKVGVILDVEELIAFPFQTFESVSVRLGLEYTPAMVNNWTRANGHKFVAAYDDEWSEKAIFSNGFSPVKRKTKARELWPAGFQRPLDKAYEFYHNMLSQPEGAPFLQSQRRINVRGMKCAFG